MSTSVRGKVQDYLQDAAMDALLRNTIIYNVAWEDPRVDCNVLKLGPEDRLLMLTTGGFHHRTISSFSPWSTVA